MSPKRVAFFDVAPGKPWKIYLISSDGGEAHAAEQRPKMRLDPTWSPRQDFRFAFSYFPLFDPNDARKSLGSSSSM